MQRLYRLALECSIDVQISQLLHAWITYVTLIDRCDLILLIVLARRVESSISVVRACLLNLWHIRILLKGSRVVGLVRPGTGLLLLLIEHSADLGNRVDRLSRVACIAALADY